MKKSHTMMRLLRGMLAVCLMMLITMGSAVVLAEGATVEDGVGVNYFDEAILEALTELSAADDKSNDLGCEFIDGDEYNTNWSLGTARLSLNYDVQTSGKGKEAAASRLSQVDLSLFDLENGMIYGLTRQYPENEAPVGIMVVINLSDPSNSTSIPVPDDMFEAIARSLAHDQTVDNYNALYQQAAGAE